jgi:predicted DCC family thiol-disulfide oxidoreductase YuxK
LEDKKDIILIDSECPLCTSSAAFIIKHSGGDYYRFVSLFSQEGKAYLDKYGFSKDYEKSVVLIHNDNALIKSDALIEIAKNLNRPYTFLKYLKI